MSIYISSSIYLAALEAMPHIVRNRPLIGWESLYGFNGVAEDVDLLASTGPRTVWSPDTYTRWQATTNSVFANEDTALVFSVADEIDYCGIGGHNFGTAGASYRWEYRDTGPENDGASYPGDVWLPITSYRIPNTDDAIIDYFDPITPPLGLVRLIVSIPPLGTIHAGHIKIGNILQLQRPNSGNPFPAGRTRSVIGEALDGDFGDYLGMIVRSEFTPWEIDQKNNRPDFVRDNIYQFIAHMNGTIRGQAGPSGTFFYAWLPDDYPTEVAYCWKDPRQDVTPRHSPTNNLMSWSCNGKGAL